ncbi:MAG: sulfotransferase [Actinomycetota bacterium]|nr:sulfotransferase [Actinomycetota bacterium]
MMPLPSFLVVGAAKSGTTALHRYLGQHPDVYLPAREEPNFFAFEGRPPDFRGPGNTPAAVNATSLTTPAAYGQLYENASPGQRAGDVSPVYLYWPTAAANIHRHLPDARICVILRHPVDRAFSAFMHARREGKEPLRDFEAGLAAEPDRIARHWGFLWRYADMGRYWGQLRRYYDLFPRFQIKVVLYDDLVKDPLALLAELFDFIGVDPGFAPDLRVRHNVSGVPRSRLAYRMLGSRGALAPLARRAAPVVGERRLRDWQARLRNRMLSRQTLAPDVRARLTVDFREDLERLGELIDRDLGHWLRVSPAA